MRFTNWSQSTKRPIRGQQRPVTGWRRAVQVKCQHQNWHRVLKSCTSAQCSDGVIRTALTKDAATCGRQELLLAVLSVGNLLGKLLRWASHVWLLTRVALELVYHDAFRGKVQLDVIQVFILVKSDLDATSTAADTLHVVFIERDGDNMTST